MRKLFHIFTLYFDHLYSDKYVPRSVGCVLRLTVSYGIEKTHTEVGSDWIWGHLAESELLTNSCGEHGYDLNDLKFSDSMSSELPECR